MWVAIFVIVAVVVVIAIARADKQLVSTAMTRAILNAFDDGYSVGEIAHMSGYDTKTINRVLAENQRRPW
jgi:hypothetical protein